MVAMQLHKAAGDPNAKLIFCSCDHKLRAICSLFSFRFGLVSRTLRVVITLKRLFAIGLCSLIILLVLSNLQSCVHHVRNI
jgi:hypothetical protein